MHDIKLIRDDPAAFDNGLKRRGLPPQSAEVLKRDAELRALLVKLQTAQARRNEASKLIGQAKAKKAEAQAQALMAEVAGLKDEIQKGEDEQHRLEAAVLAVLETIPKIPASEVPDGTDDSANREIRRAGSRPGFNFKPKEHFDLGEKLGQMDFEAAARMSGARFVVLKKGLARLERAIAQFMLDLHTEHFGYTEVSPPYLVRDHAMFGTGQLPKFKADLFEAQELQFFRMQLEMLLKAQRDGELGDVDPIDALEVISAPGRRWLIPTSEVSLTNLVREEILNEEQLPFRFTAFTPCFRAETGVVLRSVSPHARDW